MGAIPAHLRLNPKLYTSAEEARRAAEEELKSLGEEIETPKQLEDKAVKEALSMASETESDPFHSDVEGIKVDLGHTGDYAAPEEEHKPVPVQETKIETVQPVAEPQAPSNQLVSQFSESDVPMAKHSKKQATLSPKAERFDGTRPSAPQFNSFASMGFPSMPLAGFQSQMPQALQAPDLSTQVPQMFGNSPQTAPQMMQPPQLPQFPQFNQMPMFGQIPQGTQFPQLPQLPQFDQLSQFPQANLMPQFQSFMQSSQPMNPQQIPNMLQQMSQFLQPSQQGFQAPVPFFFPSHNVAKMSEKVHHHKKH
eukprot:c15863_g1_i1.p1 GENE.c15863_g1_i1~~c15863_g1_i1.p1  ORF type:complete len:355 (+),score=75.81 c15863_g1_i1:144-1067(+)